MRMRLFFSALLSLFPLAVFCVEPNAAPLQEAPEVQIRSAGLNRLLPDLSFTDLNGKSGSVGESLKNARALVIAATSTSCPVSKKYLPTLATLEKTWGSRGVRFLFVNSTKSDQTDAAKKLATEAGLAGSYIEDKTGKLAQAFSLQTTAEVIVLDAARTSVYRGAVDDQYGIGYTKDKPVQSYLSNALEAMLADKKLDVSATSAPGCALEFPAQTAAAQKTAVPTFHGRVSRLLQANCQDCHHDSGVAPFPLISFDDATSHAGMMRKVLQKGLMPPWFATAPEKNHPTPWANDRSMPEEDKADILAWLDAGAPEGDKAEAPLPRKFSADWQLEKTDLVLQIPKAIDVQATGKMPYQNAYVETRLTEDKWISGLEVRPSNREVVHHVLVFVLSGQQAEAARKGGRPRHDEEGFFGAYVPGSTAVVYPEGFAKFLPAGSILQFQLHYTPNGSATQDQTRIGMVFADQPAQHEVKVASVLQHRLNIPAGAANHEEVGKKQVPMDAAILAYMPHMHTRGKAFRLEMALPDGSKKTLLEVRRYDFNWQLSYRLKQPQPVSAGSTLVATGWFDNSANNPANPDPARNVRWGMQTDEEMLIGYVEYFIPGETPGSSQKTNLPTPAETFVLNKFNEADKNRDGKVTPEEFPRPALFKQLDQNQDALVTLEELRAVLKR